MLGASRPDERSSLVRRVIFSIAALLLGSALLHVGGGLLGTLLGLRMALTEFSEIVAGAVMSSFFVGYILGVSYAHRLIGGVGHIRAYAALASLVSAATLLHPFWVAAMPWAILRALQGFCLAGLAVCTESWLNERATNTNRGQVLSFYMIAVYLAQAGGQFMLNLRDPSGFGLFVIASVMVSLALVPVALTRVVAPTPPKPSRFGLRELYVASPLGLVGACVSGIILGAFYGLAPFFAQQVGFTVAETSQLMGAAILGGLLLQWPLGKLSDLVDRRTVIGGLTAGIAVIGAGAAVASGWSVEALILIAPFLGGVIFTLYPLSVAHTNDFIDATDLVPASGALILCYGLGAALGPIGASGLMLAMGPAGLFAFIAACGLATAAFAAWRMRVRAAPRPEETVPYYGVPHTSAAVAELDPRGETAEPELELYPPDTATPGPTPAGASGP
jgi:MFS family permease